MKKIKSYFINSSDKYTKWGLIINWAIILVPIAWFGITFRLGSVLQKTQEGTEDLKDQITGADAFWTFSWFILFLFFGYAVIYKAVRFFWKPKKVRQRKNEKTENPKDAFWGD